MGNYIAQNPPVKPLITAKIISVFEEVFQLQNSAGGEETIAFVTTVQKLCNKLRGTRPRVHRRRDLHVADRRVRVEQLVEEHLNRL